MKRQKEDKAPEVEATTDTVRRTQLWFLEYEIARAHGSGIMSTPG
jgi:hypothetical protein